jgi:tetratricopeptide (TPR) repeat protein
MCNRIIKIIGIIFFAGFVSNSSLAQNNTIDSLKDLLKQHPGADSVRLNLLNDLSFSSYELRPNEGITFADEAIILSKKLLLPDKLGSAFYYKGLCMGVLGNYDDALAMLGEATKIYETINVHKLWDVNNSIAIIYMNLSDYGKALNIYFKNMIAAEQRGDEKKMAVAATNISLLYTRIDKQADALKYNEKAIGLYKKTGNANALANAYAARGNIYDDMDSLLDAINSYREGLLLSERSKYQIGIANNAGNMGSVFGELEKYDSAFYFTKKGLDIYSSISYKRNMAILYGYLGDIIISSSAAVLLQEGISPSNKFITALEYYNKAMNLHKEIGNKLEEATSWQQISNVYKLQQNYEQAYNSFEKYTSLKENALNENENKAIEKLTSQYEFQKKTDSIKEANNKRMIIVAAEIKREKAINNATLFGGLILSAAGVIVFIFYKRNRDIAEEKVEAKFAAKVADTEMKALRSQMNPHFIFNSLNSISDYISTNDAASANKYLTRFAKVMRMILENSEQKEVTLENDLKALELYMQLESLRLQNKFTYTITIDDTIDAENTMVPPLILQPFVENSIWHGLSQKEGEGRILIQVKKEGDMIHCIVEDNGTGRVNGTSYETVNGAKKSLGMKITKSRIDILNKLKNSNAAVTISDLPEGTRAEVKLPLELSF